MAAGNGPGVWQAVGSAWERSLHRAAAMTTPAPGGTAGSASGEVCHHSPTWAEDTASPAPVTFLLTAVLPAAVGWARMRCMDIGRPPLLPIVTVTSTSPEIGWTDTKKTVGALGRLQRRQGHACVGRLRAGGASNCTSPPAGEVRVPRVGACLGVV